jgi:uncharacterized membrane protein YebE (DUF533 family)
MFLKGLHKIATSFAMISPEEYEDLATSKDPLVGALVGGKAGALVGALKSKHGHRAKGAVLGDLAGTAVGALAGKGVSSAKKWQAHRFQRYTHELNLRSTPTRRRRNSGE